ncbi:hypothetical protein GCM10007301_24350 [Azorhizobium oxalatiphilum]|uniref:Cytochrome c domain-containing protein n=1 Tax=Azorhizobium oxalatiphilum TaxID=980631 RepID=A0A917BYR5_9HYPH|nr:cytochrome c [Azorhizobium oxalatiphilum]GGF63682.1 hypothetical protein GCM10007301_24350 [Azorhizobium oxalatiphilum]
MAEADNERPTPVERILARRRWLWLVVGLLVVAAAVYYLVAVNQYVIAYHDPDDHFRHGSIGSETASGLPYWVFKALPVLYADKLGPQGYRRFGLLYEDEVVFDRKPGAYGPARPGPRETDLPIGFSRRVVSGVERVWMNCSVCHVGTYRVAGDPTRHAIDGAPANNLRLQALIRFLLDVGRDPGFNADSLIATIQSPEVGGNLNVFERLIYRYIVFPRVKAALLELGTRLEFVYRQEDWGPGRVDTFNPYKAIQFNFPMGPDYISDTALNGSSDYPAIWRQAPREGMNLHWDGNNSSVAERNLSAALGAGVTPTTVDRPAIGRIESWMWRLPPPRFPDSARIDATKVETGRRLFSAYCGECHGQGAPAAAGGYDYDTRRHPRLGQVEKLEDIGTDPGRWASYTREFSAGQNLLYAGYPWRFKHFRKTGGYANHPLDGIWARSPYLHNGSVPTLRDLLEPSASRPAVWFRGGEEFDLERVGYKTDAASGSDLFRYDTSRPGNGNAGHEGRRYGTELPASEKDALVEYMKTL